MKLRARGHAEFGLGDLRVRCGEAVEDLEHIVHQCPAWSADPASLLEAPSCLRLHGLLPVPKRQVVDSWSIMNRL
eukprot:4410052-Amphidinium_carterae.2